MVGTAMFLDFGEINENGDRMVTQKPRESVFYRNKNPRKH